MTADTPANLKPCPFCGGIAWKPADKIMLRCSHEDGCYLLLTDRYYDNLTQHVGWQEIEAWQSRVTRKAKLKP